MMNKSVDQRQPQNKTSDRNLKYDPARNFY